MADKKISELDSVMTLNNDAAFPMSQDNGGDETTYKATLTTLAAKIAEDMTFSNLTTTSKKLVGAINELKANGATVMLGTTAPTAQQGNNGNVYIQYTAGTGGAADEVDALFVKINGAWCEVETGGSGSGGHTIVDDNGTDLTQRASMQFKGTYSTDNSTDGVTEVNITRSMTKAAYNQLSADEKVGLINITDEASITGTELPMSTTEPNSMVADRIEALETKIANTTGTCTINATNCNSGNVSYAKSGNIVTVGGYIYTKGTWSGVATAVFELPFKPAIDLNPTAQTVVSGDTYKTTYLNVSSSFFNVRLDNSVENNQLLRFGFSYVAVT